MCDGESLELSLCLNRSKTSSFPPPIEGKEGEEEAREMPDEEQGGEIDCPGEADTTTPR